MRLLGNYYLVDSLLYNFVLLCLYFLLSSYQIIQNCLYQLFIIDILLISIFGSCRLLSSDDWLGKLIMILFENCLSIAMFFYTQFLFKMYILLLLCFIQILCYSTVPKIILPLFLSVIVFLNCFFSNFYLLTAFIIPFKDIFFYFLFYFILITYWQYWLPQWRIFCR